MLHFCTYEDRPANRVGLKLLMLSFDHFSAGSVLTVFLPKPDPSLQEWTMRRTSRVRLRVLVTCAKGWSVKPEVMLSHMVDINDGDSCIWLDADILAIRSFERVFAGLPADHIVTAQDFYSTFNPDSGKAAFWGWNVIRQLGCTVNSSVLRMTLQHRELLVTWQTCLQSDAFLKEQAKSHDDRKPEVYSDQDVLEALLSSDAPGRFDRFPVEYLRTGQDVVHEHHYYSYRAKHRLLNAVNFGKPIFIHCQCAKPWILLEGLDPDVVAVMAYVRAAVRWRSQLDEDVEAWMDLSTPLSRWAKRVTFDSVHAQGLALWVRDRTRRIHIKG